MPINPPAAAWPSVENWLAPIGVSDGVRAFLGPVVVAIGAIIVVVGTGPAGASKMVSRRAIRRLPGVELNVGTALPDTVELHEVPNVKYRYGVVDNQTVVVSFGRSTRPSGS
jgi:hypothetical protein